MKTLALIRRVLLVLVLAAGIIFLLPHGSTAATGFSFAATTTYRVVDDATTAVTEQYTVTNQTARQFLTQIKLTTPVDTVSNLVAHYSDGGIIPTKSQAQSSDQSGVTYNYQQVTLNFPRQDFGNGKSWSFELTYNATGLVESHGGAHTVYVPSVQANSTYTSYNARIDVPLGFGAPHFQGAQAAKSTINGDRQDFDFAQSALLAHSLALSFGNETIYRVNFNFPLINNSAFAHTDTVTLPPNLNNQQVQVQSLDPQPVATHLDGDGNILADYRVPAHTHEIVKTVVTGEVKYLEYNLAASATASAIPPALVHQYTAATQYWQTGGAVGAEAKSLDNPNAPVIDNVRAMYNYVVDHLTYNPNKIKFNIRQGAAMALANPTNVVCLEYSDLLIAMLRSQGIPARMPIGYGYTGNLKASASVVDSLHSWVEAYVPGIGWMTLDPTWGEKFDLFGQSDLDHFAFAVWGSKDQLPAPVMSGGQDTNYQYEQTTLDYVNTPSASNHQAQLSIRRMVLLPGVVLDRVSVKAAAGSVSQSNAVSYAGIKLKLGDLAPGQQVVRYRFVFGRAWLRAPTAALMSLIDSQSLISARTIVIRDQRPLEGLSGLLVLGLVLLIMVRLRTHRSGPQPPVLKVTS